MELVIDSFAGGGGASTGIEMAIGRSVDIAINHDEDAILMHRTNHSSTKHYCENIWQVDPVVATKGKPVALCWFSPDCKHFSKAKGGIPVDKNIRGLAWVAVKWASKVRPRVIILENVEEFKTWGPVIEGKPINKDKGKTFKKFIKALNNLGYKVDWKELKACDYGAPTIRKRFFLIARCDGQPIVWKEPTHVPKDSLEAIYGLKKPYMVAKDIIDWSLPSKSIFERSKKLSDSTLKRIVNGIYKYIDNNEGVYTYGNKASVLLQMGYGDPEGKRSMNLNKPLGTITAGGNKFAIATVELEKGDKPLENIKAFLIKYYGKGIGQSVYEPLHTITTKDRFGLVTIEANNYVITDIKLRMLQPKELFLAQGFPENYIIDKDYKGNSYAKSKQIARCGNAVVPILAKMLVESNLPELCNKSIKEVI